MSVSGTEKCSLSKWVLAELRNVHYRNEC